MPNQTNLNDLFNFNDLSSLDKLIEKLSLTEKSLDELLKSFKTTFNEIGKSAKKAQGELEKLNPTKEEDQKKLSDLAKQVENLTKKLNELKNKESELIQSRKDLNKESEKTSRAINIAKKSAQDLKRAEDNLKKSTGATAQEIAKLKVQTQENNKANKEAAKSALNLISPYQKLSNDLIKARKEFKDLAAQEKQNTIRGKELIKNITQLDKKLKGIDASVGQFQRSVGNYDKAFGRLNSSVSQFNSAFGVTLGLFGSINLFKDATTTIKDFEKANAVLAGVLNTDLKGVKTLTDDAKRLGSETSKSASEVTALQESLARLGFAEKDIINLTPSLIDGSVALNSGLDATATLVGSVVKTFDDLSTTDATQIVDSLTASTQKSALSFEKLETALPIVGGAANALGIPLEETLSLLGKLSDAGIDASSASTALRNIFLKSAKDGVPYEKLLGDITSSQTKLAKANELFGARGAVVASVLAKNTEQVKELQKDLEAAGGTAESVAKTQLDTLAGTIEIAKSAWEGFVLSLNDGEGFLTNTLRSALTFFIENVKTIGTVLFGAAAAFIAYKAGQLAVNAVITISTKITDAYSFVVDTLAGKTKLAIAAQKVWATTTGILTGKINLVKKAQLLWNKAINANPIFLIITGITALIGVVELLSKSYDDASKAANKLAESQRRVAESNAEEIKSTEDAINKRIRALKRDNATKEEINKARKQGVEELQGVLANAQADETQAIEETTKVLEDNIKRRNELLLREAGLKEAEKATAGLIGGATKIVDIFTDEQISVQNIRKEIDDLNKAIKENEQTRDNASKSLNNLNKQSADNLEKLKDLEVESTKITKEEQLKRQKAARAALIASINDQIAAERRRLLASEEFSQEELDSKKRLEDLKAKLQIVSNEKATKNQIALIREQAIANKKELDKQFGKDTFDNQIESIDNLFSEILLIETQAFEEGLNNQKQFSMSSLEIEEARLEEVIKATEEAGNETLELEIKLQQTRNKLLDIEAQNRVDLIEDTKQKELELDQQTFDEAQIKAKQNALKSEEERKSLDDNLLQLQIDRLKSEQQILDLAAQERLNKELEAAKQSEELAKEVAKKNEEIAKEDAKRQLEIQDELADIELQKQQELLDKKAEQDAKAKAREDIIRNAVFERIQKEQFREAELLEQKAEAAESEEEKEAFRRKAAEERSKAEFKVALIQAFQASLQQGKSVEEALSDTALTAAALTIVGREKGGGVEGGEQLIRINEKGEEFVVDHKTTAALGLDGKSTMKDFYKSINDMQLANMTMNSLPSISTIDYSLSQDLNIDYDKLSSKIGKEVAKNVPKNDFVALSGKLGVLQTENNKMRKYILELGAKNTPKIL